MPDGWTSEVRALDTARILRVMQHHGVKVIVVGGIAAVLHRWSGSTFDLDLVPQRTTANLNRLGLALQVLTAEVWADPARQDLSPMGKPPEADDFGYTAEGLRRHEVWHLMSSAGPIDIASSIEGVGGYEALRVDAEERRVFDVDVVVASLQDIIASKRAAARPKDLRALPELEDLLSEQQ